MLEQDGKTGGAGAIRARQMLTADGWRHDMTLIHDAAGRIIQLAEEKLPGAVQVDILLPAPVNLHSHGFQRAMAGRAEQAGPAGGDSFWTWREVMYGLVAQLSPEDVAAISALAYIEMLERGFVRVAEFHYLHHQPDGRPYDDPAEMALAVAAAADRTGMGLTMCPVLYQRGSCDGRPLAGGQQRFGLETEDYLSLHRRCAEISARLYPDAQAGVAFHSLRAVGEAAMREVLDAVQGGPVHLHIAEQRAEIAEVEAATGQRPVAWLLDHFPVDPRWCVVHATHMTADETTALARSGAVAGLCPVTEANLGDGIFPAPDWLSADGRFGVGSDSNVAICLREELRLLEYGQRLAQEARAAFAPPGGSVGRALWDGAVAGGAQAAGLSQAGIREGAWADLVALDGAALELEGRQGDEVLDGFVFAGRDGLIRDVWSAGRHVVTQGRHVARDMVENGWRKAMGRLFA